MKITIKCNSWLVQKTILNLIQEAGYHVGEDVFREDPDLSYPYVYIDNEDVSCNRSIEGFKGFKHYTAAKFIENFENIMSGSITVKLNENYTAVVTKNTITVGCQTFPTSIVQKLVDAVNKVK